MLKIPCSFSITLPTGQKMRADHAARLVAADAWQTASAGHGSKGLVVSVEDCSSC